MFRRRITKWLKKKDARSGDAALSKTENAARLKEPSLTESPSFLTSVMEAMEVEENAESIFPQKSSTSVEHTTNNGPWNTVWMTNLQKLAEEPWEELEGLDLSALPTHLQGKLLLLADGRNEPVAAVIHQICQYLSEEEAPYCEGPLIDGVVFFLENEIQ